MLDMLDFEKMDSFYFLEKDQSIYLENFFNQDRMKDKMILNKTILIKI